MIKLRKDVDALVVSNEIKLMIENLECLIDRLLKVEVGINISTKASAHDVVLTADFEDETGLDEYRIHPEHIKVLDYLKSVMEKTAVVDYLI